MWKYGKHMGTQWGNMWTYGKHMGKIWETMNQWSTTPGRPQAALWNQPTWGGPLCAKWWWSKRFFWGSRGLTADPQYTLRH
jgi:hypothetical protein